MNHPSKYQCGDDSRRIASSTAHPAVDALNSKISSDMGNFSAYTSTPTVVSKHTTATDDTRKGTDKQVLRIPTKSENSKPGPILNASCASGLALGGEISDLSLTALVERIHADRGNAGGPLQNEGWDDLPSSQNNLFQGNGDN